MKITTSIRQQTEFGLVQELGLGAGKVPAVEESETGSQPIGRETLK